MELVPVDAPVLVEAIARPRSAWLRWTPPASTGGAPVLGFFVRTLPAGPTLEVASPATEAIVEGLEDGARHAFEVSVRTIHGLGPTASSGELTLPRLPSAPLQVLATPSMESAVVSWSPPEDEGGSPLTAFHVTASPGGSRRTVEAGATSLVFSGLAPGVAHRFSVSAENAVGEGAASTPSEEVVPVSPADLISLSSAPEAGGCVILQLELSQPEGLAAELRVEVDVEGLGGFVPATLLESGQSFPPGIHTVVWNSSADFPGRTGQVSLRASASLFGVPGAAGSASLQVTNALAFGPAATFPTIDGPVATLAADVSLDGVVDVIVLGSAPGQVAVHRGTGKGGSFYAPWVLPLGGMPTGMALGHLDGDLHPDLVVTIAKDDTVRILRGNGDGTFQAPVAHSAPVAPGSVTLADVNRDGFTDVVVAGQRVAVLLGVGDGTLQPAVLFPVGTGPLTVALAALIPGGRLDLIVGSRVDGGVWVAPGVGDGTFGRASLSPVGDGLTTLDVGDTDGDGVLDVVVGNAEQLSLLRGSGNGTLLRPLHLPVGAMPDRVVVADLDGDGREELLTSVPSKGEVRIWRGGAGKDGFLSPVDVPVLDGLGTLLAADLDANGTRELLATNPGSGKVAVVQNLLPQHCGSKPAP